MDRKGISDQHLADKIGLRRESVFRWRNGSIKSPKQEKIKECAPVLGLTSEELDELLAAAKRSKHAKSRRSGKSEPRQPEEIIFSEDEPVIPVTTRPIIHPRQFFGHNALLKKIFQAWNQRTLEHVFITGPKRSGKTSLLNYIRKIHHAKSLRSGQRSDWLKIDYNWVYMNFTDARLLRQDSFFSYALNELKLSTQASDLIDFAAKLEDNLDNPVIFLMDNIEKGLAADELDEIFWGHIRAMGQNCDGIRIGFCGASCLSAHELQKESENLNKPSPFFNSLEEIKLGPLSEEEARELIACSPKPFSPKDTDWILEQSERWPVLLQLLCKARLAALEENTTAWKQTVSDNIKFHQHLLTSAKNRLRINNAASSSEVEVLKIADDIERKKNKRQLTKLLLECPSIKDTQNRLALLAQLPSYIAVTIKTHDNPTAHVANIVDACMNHNNGLEYLLDALCFFDGETMQTQKVIEFIKHE
ncbi:MAG: hypothetical protein GY862_26040 [Gammaproteobacteria bacterium]|nr:hypothetical protein [Gammaproteobacteria bacterium]